MMGDELEVHEPAVEAETWPARFFVGLVIGGAILVGAAIWARRFVDQTVGQPPVLEVVPSPTREARRSGADPGVRCPGGCSGAGCAGR